MTAKRRALAERRKAAGYSQEALAETLRVEPSTVGRWERGEAAPQPWFRPKLGRLLGLSMAELEALLAAGPALAAVDACDRQFASDTANEGRQGAKFPVFNDLRRAVLDYGDSQPGRRVATRQLETEISEAHRLYQVADYDAAARLLSSITYCLHVTVGKTAVQPVVQPATKAAAYLAIAKLANKLGDVSLAWVAADRGVRAATETDQRALVGVANYQVACALLGSGHTTDAEYIATGAADSVTMGAPSKDALSARGALLLLLSIMVARRGDGRAARKYLHDATHLANELGRDGNQLWTAFGPTNVSIHELAVHVALGDTRSALQLGEEVNTDGLPAVLRGRRSQVHLELGRASAGQGDDSLAVLHLLEAERVAKQTISRNATARTLLTTLLARERKCATPGLRALASRAGVLQ